MKTEKAEKVESRRLEAEKVQTEEMQVKGIQEEGVQVKGMKIEEAELEKMVQHQMRIIRQGAEALIGEEKHFYGKALKYQVWNGPQCTGPASGACGGTEKIKADAEAGASHYYCYRGLYRKNRGSDGKKQGEKSVV